MTENRKKILIIDDDETFVKLLADALAERPYNVVSARDGEEGFSKFVTDEPDLTLLDIRMPKMDGVEFLRSLRAQKVQKRPKIFICSNYPAIEHIADGVELGVKSYIAKADVNIDGIAERIDRELAS